MLMRRSRILNWGLHGNTDATRASTLMTESRTEMLLGTLDQLQGARVYVAKFGKQYNLKRSGRMVVKNLGFWAALIRGCLLWSLYKGDVAIVILSINANVYTVYDLASCDAASAIALSFAEARDLFSPCFPF